MKYTKMLPFEQDVKNNRHAPWSTLTTSAWSSLVM